MLVEASRAGDSEDFCFRWLLEGGAIQNSAECQRFQMWKGHSEVFQILAQHSSHGIAGARSVSTHHHQM